MSLKPIESKDLSTFFRTGAFTEGHYFYSVSQSQPPYKRAIGYYDRLDALYLQMKINKDPASHTEVHAAFDPLGLDNESPVSRYGLVQGGERSSMFCVGEWDKLANTQHLYGGSDPPNQFRSMDPVTFLFEPLGPPWRFPFLWWYGGGGTGVIGGWQNGGGASGNWVFFETWGYALHGCTQVRHTDNVVYRGMALVDLATAKATLLDVPTFYTSFPGALFEAPEFNGESFALGLPQFAGDDDSVPAAPKGEIFLFSVDYLGDAVPPYLDVPSHVYIKVIDWNPLGVAAAPGTPSRVHLRETLMTQMHFLSHQAFGTNLNSLGAADDGGSPSVRQLKHFYHPPTRTIVTFNDMKWSTFDNQRGIVRHSITPLLAVMEPPTAQSEVETNKTVVFKAKGLGDLNDPVAGIDALWSLARRSTVDEILDTSLGPVANIVAHPPMDEGSCVVKYLGVPLVETTDYNVVEATGTITWAGTHAPPNPTGYTASYLHSTVSATPAHGTLLQAVSETDEDGTAETRVQYGDETWDDGRERDRITVEMSDD